ncbi:MAG TPA: CmcJ/NvfI family oxidoreductase [Candidatus Binataceae bacterium]
MIGSKAHCQMDRLSRPEPESVRAQLLYVADPDARSSEASDGSPGRSKVHWVTITNAWRCSALTLDRNGFLALRSPSAVENFYEANEVRNRFYPELEKLLRAAAGASKVTVFAHDVRCSDRTRREATGVREPVLYVHNDYTPVSGPQMVRDVLAPAQAHRRLRGRMVEINVWRPIKGPVLDHPLAVCDAGSIAPDDLIAVSEGLRHEVFMLRYNPAHRWYYFPRLEADEVILIKGFDSASDGRARFTAHAAFADPSTRPDAPPRESIEARALLFFD